jgi:hypothetical protein
MSRFSDPGDFVCGTYLIEFDSGGKASEFIERFRGCPVWPIVTRGPVQNQIFVLAVELRRQSHGDFSQEHNTLVHNPQYLGARAVRFRRDDDLLALFDGYELRTGYAQESPCGSDCEGCPLYRDPCRGCPARFEIG